MNIRHGHLYLADLEPRFGSEAGKLRPVLVIQTDLLNQAGHPSTWILPCTTRLAGANLLRVELLLSRLRHGPVSVLAPSLQMLSKQSSHAIPVVIPRSINGLRHTDEHKCLSPIRPGNLALQYQILNLPIDCHTRPVKVGHGQSSISPTRSDSPSMDPRHLRSRDLLDPLRLAFSPVRI